ncbi:AraC family transcriptional regulator [Roseiarcus fermentans]|uniref:AraC family transcriptional regulator n=1 Tax=Roseiarcus fermentans TaxID=1473586 RepID=A0A366FT16_9HYPH|nr:helix-turn-helix domain-containing protein [Roseiarcus fermentans]RBP17286.1 AraC family transcriptional regulator [Roseiarcus fermentans]
MRVVFDTKTLATARRGEAWREAICEIYLQVDCMAEKQKDYTGFVREARFGAVTLTDTLCSPQSIQRRAHHTAHFDKDCYYFGIEHVGEINIDQAGLSFPIRTGIGTLYYANEPYSLRCYVKSRQFWAELPREAFDRRFDSGRPPLLTSVDLTRGLGRIAAEFCSSLAQENAHVDGASRERLGEQLMDILALALHGEPGRQSADEKSVQLARLGSIKAYIEANLGDPSLSPAIIAKQNGISLRYLHQLFRLTDMSVSEWLRLRRLQRCHDLLASPQNANRSITEIAYSMGFSSSSHFSNLFRAQFKVRPSDVKGAYVRSSRRAA